MNIAGTIANGIFALTVVTATGAVISYVTFKARDRSRRKRQRPNAEPDLVFFFEHHLAPAIEPAAERGTWWRVAAKFALLMLVLGGATAAVVFVFGAAAPAAPGRAVPAVRAQPLAVDPHVSRAGSPFVTPEGDLDGDGQVGLRERPLVQLVPQFVLVTSDDNGAADGLSWVQGEARAHGITGALTYFNTANYLSGRKNYLGGPIDELWQQLASESFVGLHGTTHATGGQHWTVERWRDEHQTALDEVVHRLTPPEGWSWDRYPFGSRAPFMAVDAAYFTGLEQLVPAIVYDSSLQLIPRRRDVELATEARDLPWPFTLDQPLPVEITIGADEVGRHPIWEVPAAAWRLRPASGAPTWTTSMDVDLFRVHPCTGAISQAAVDDVLANLDAHYRGNRSPFHLGLHAQEYAAGHGCQRATVAAILDGIARKRADGLDIQMISIPDLLGWLERKRTSPTSGRR